MEKSKLNILLLRGLGREAAHWGTFPSVLEKTIPGAKCHALDLPGAGKERTRESPALIPLISEDVRSRWIPLRTDSSDRWMVVGISLGAMVACDWLARNGEDFKKGVLINPSAANVSPFWKRMRWQCMPLIAETLLYTDVSSRERLILKIVSNKKAQDPTTIANWVKIAEERPITRWMFLNQMVAASRFHLPRELAQPVLVLNSSEDRIVDSECGTEVAKRLKAELETHPEAGHDLPLDDPEWVANKIKAFA